MLVEIMYYFPHLFHFNDLIRSHGVKHDLGIHCSLDNIHFTVSLERMSFDPLVFHLTYSTQYFGNKIVFQFKFALLFC